LDSIVDRDHAGIQAGQTLSHHGRQFIVGHCHNLGMSRRARLAATAIVIPGRAGVPATTSSRAKPVENAFVEVFNSRLRDDYLNERVFMSLAEVSQLIENWRHDHSCCRPHSSLG
jgi:transposase InsO family protein